MKPCPDCKLEYDETRDHECWQGDYMVVVEADKPAEEAKPAEKVPVQPNPRGRPVDNTHNDGLTAQQRWKKKNKARINFKQKELMRKKRAEAKAKKETEEKNENL